MAEYWARARDRLGFGPPPDAPDAEAGSLLRQALAQVDEATTLTRTQRMIGFATCLGTGLLFGALSTLFLITTPRKFAALSALSSLLSTSATFFLVGPAKQLRAMCAPVRAAAAAAYVGALAFTLVSALYLRSTLLTLVAVAIQFCALVWYSLSYIPYARGAAWSAVSAVLGTE